MIKFDRLTKSLSALIVVWLLRMVSSKRFLLLRAGIDIFAAFVVEVVRACVVGGFASSKSHDR